MRVLGVVVAFTAAVLFVSGFGVAWFHWPPPTDPFLIGIFMVGASIVSIEQAAEWLTGKTWSLK